MRPFFYYHQKCEKGIFVLNMNLFSLYLLKATTLLPAMPLLAGFIYTYLMVRTILISLGAGIQERRVNGIQYIAQPVADAGIRTQRAENGRIPADY